MNSSDVIAAVAGVVQADQAKIANIMATLRGGWEAWLQVEAGLSLVAALGVGATANREVNYPAPDAAKRADLFLQPRAGTGIFVELKVQNANIADNIMVRYAADIAKIAGLSAATKTTYVVVACAYIVTFTSDDITRLKLSKPAGTLQLLQWDGTKWVDTAAGTTDPHRPVLAAFKLA